MEITSHLFAIAGLLVLVRIGGHKMKGVSAPEAPGALPIIGHLHQLRGENPIARSLAAMADRHGPIFMIRFGMKRALVVNNHEAVKECFTANDRILAGRPRSTQGKYLGYNYAGFGFAPYGTYLREMRKLATTELLSARRLEALKNVQVSEVDTLVKDLYSLCKSNNHSPVKVVISEWIERLALNIITKMTGAGSTAVTLTWVISLLLNNPSVLKAAQEELDREVGKNKWVQESDIKNLNYLQAIVKETLRLYPPGPVTGIREAMEDCNLAGYHVSKGTSSFDH